MPKLSLRSHRKLMLQRALEMQRMHPNPSSFETLIAWLTEKLEQSPSRKKKRGEGR